MKREEIVGFLTRLVSFRSVTGEELQIQEFIAKKLEDDGASG